MLKLFRNASHGLFTKILFGAIIFSFCLWGVGDIIRNYSASRPVIKVSDFSINSDVFSREYMQTKQRIRNSGEKGLTDEELNNIDIKGIVIDKLINDCILDQTFKKQHLTVSKKIVARLIESVPEFQKDGVFSEDIYLSFLQKIGINESAFVHNLEQDTLRKQLLHPISVGYVIPTFVKNVIINDFDLRRTVVIGKLNVDGVGLNGDLTEEDVEEYYMSNIEKYKVPESRDASIVVLDYSSLADKINITENEIKEYYEANKEYFKAREYRSFERFTFQTAEDADKAWEMLNKDSAHAVKNIESKLGVQPEDLYDMEQQSFLPKIGTELFALKKTGAVSNIYNVGEQYYIYKLKKISKPDERSQKEINEEIRETLKNERTNTPEFYQEIKNLRNEVDDRLAEGQSIDKISQLKGVRVVNVSNVTTLSEDIKEFNELTGDDSTKKDIKDAIFNTETDQSSLTIEARDIDTVSFIVFVKAVRKEHVQKLDDIHNKVKKDLETSKKREKAKSAADKIIEKSDGAITSISNLKNVKTLKFSKKDLVLHEKNPNKDVTELLKIMPNANVAMDFIASLKKGKAQYFTDQNGDYIFVGVKNIESTFKSDDQFDSFVSQHIDNGASGDISKISLAAFKSKLKIDINEKSINKITTRINDEENSESQDT